MIFPKNHLLISIVYFQFKLCLLLSLLFSFFCWQVQSSHYSKASLVPLLRHDPSRDSIQGPTLHEVSSCWLVETEINPSPVWAPGCYLPIDFQYFFLKFGKVPSTSVQISVQSKTWRDSSANLQSSQLCSLFFSGRT